MPEIPGIRRSNDHHVGGEFRGRGHGVLPIGGLTDHLKIGFNLEHRPQPLPEGGMVVEHHTTVMTGRAGLP